MPLRSIVLSLLFALLCVTLAQAASEQKSSEQALGEYYDLQEGKRLYEQYGWLSHGELGKGKVFCFDGWLDDHKDRVEHPSRYQDQDVLVEEVDERPSERVLVKLLG